MISFSDARLLSYDHQHKYFGDNLNYGVEKHLTIEGNLYNLTNFSGVSGIWNSLSNMVSTAIDYDSVVINGVNFGAGRINNINFTEGQDVRKKPYVVDLIIFDSGNLYNMNGPDFDEISLPDIHLTENFNESFDFAIAEDGTYSYKQNINVRYIKGSEIANPISSAKRLASGLFNASTIYGFIDNQHSGFYNSFGRRTYTENYNKITNECSFSENFTQGENSGDYSVKYTQEVNTAEDGISTLSENGQIKGLFGPDFIGSAYYGLDIVLSSAYSRASNLLNVYVPNTRALNSSHVSLQKKINQFTDSIDYSVVYNNDPRNNSTYSWENTIDISRSNTCYYIIKENGKIQGISQDCTRAEQYNNALNGWAIVSPGIAGRVAQHYQNISHLNNSLKLISKSQKVSPHDGNLSYEYTYTDDLLYLIAGNIKRIETEVQTTKPTLVYRGYDVVNVGKVIQNLKRANPGQVRVSVNVLGRRNAVLSNYFGAAMGSATSHRPGGSDVFVQDCNYSFSPTNNTFKFDITWTYFINTLPSLFI